MSERREPRASGLPGWAAASAFLVMATGAIVTWVLPPVREPWMLAGDGRAGGLGLVVAMVAGACVIWALARTRSIGTAAFAIAAAIAAASSIPVVYPGVFLADPVSAPSGGRAVVADLRVGDGEVCAGYMVPRTDGTAERLRAEPNSLRAECWWLAPDSGSAALVPGTGSAVMPGDIDGDTGLTFALGARHACALVWTATANPFIEPPSTTRTWCWGAGDRGQIGAAASRGVGVGLAGLEGSPVPLLQPVSVPLQFVLAEDSVLVAGRDHTCAIVHMPSSLNGRELPGAAFDRLRAGGLWCWGANDHGQVGNGTRSDVARPVRIDIATAGSSVPGIPIAVALGDSHTCALVTPAEEAAYAYGAPPFTWDGQVPGFRYNLGAPGGQVYCWGAGDHGQTGAAGPEDVLEPALVKLGDKPLRARNIAAAGAGTCATRAATLAQEPPPLNWDRAAEVWVDAYDGQHELATQRGTWCWGSNRDRQLGVPEVRDYTAPALSVLAGEPGFGEEIARDGTVELPLLQLGASRSCLVSAFAASCTSPGGPGLVTPPGPAAFAMDDLMHENFDSSFLSPSGMRLCAPTDDAAGTILCADTPVGSADAVATPAVLQPGRLDLHGVVGSTGALLALLLAAAFATVQEHRARRVVRAAAALVLVWFSLAGLIAAAAHALGIKAELALAQSPVIVLTQSMRWYWAGWIGLMAIGIIGAVPAAASLLRDRIAAVRRDHPDAGTVSVALILLGQALFPARRVAVAVESERARVAAELHADVLPILRRSLREAEDGGSPERLSRDLQAAVEDVEAMLTRRRSIVLEELGLVSALEWLAERTEEHTGLTVGIDIGETAPGGRTGDGGARPPRQVERAVFRVAVLAIENSAKHAPGSAVVVTVAVSEASIQLDITDDGPGLRRTAEEALRAGRRGLADMVAEAESVGARVAVGPATTSADRPGVAVRFRWQR